MNSMSKQMELFEPVERGFQDGGLMDEGGTVDPVSGNDVPPGSTQEEVRDDIPAQLSEGEFVFPADVVRYFGLEKLMEMRQEAKMGLQRMEDMGQMGNSEEAIMPDNLPFDIEDLDIDEEDEYNDTMEMARGGVVHAAAGTFMAPGTGFSYQAPATTGQTGYSAFRGTPAPAGATPLGYTTPTMAGPTYTTATGTTNLPTFGQTVGSAQTTPTTYKTYVNAAGQTQQIPFQNGKPLYPIPTGFTLQSATPTTPTTPTTTTSGGQTSGGGDDGGDRFDTTATKVTSAKVPSFLEGIFGKTEQPAGSPSDKFFDVRPTDAFAGNAQFGMESSELAKATAAQGMYQTSLIGVGGIGSALAKEFGLMDFNMKDMAVAGQTGKVNALNALGYGDPQQLSSLQQADLVGKAMSAAHKAAKAGQDPNKAIQGVLNSPEATTAKVEALNNLRDQLAPNGSYADVASVASQLSDTYKEQRSNLLAGGFDNEIGGKGVVTDSSGKAVQSKDGPVMTGAGKALKDALDAKIARTDAAANLASSDFAGSAEAYNENVRAGTDFATSFGAFRGSSEDDDNDSGPSDNNNDGPQGDEATGGSVSGDMSDDSDG